MYDVQSMYLRRARIIASILSFAPFVRMIALTGSLARREAREKSDIDFFIVTKANRLWSGRAFVSILIHLTGYRRYDMKIAGRICLNCYQTEDHLTVNPNTIKNAKDYSNIKILYQSHGLAKRFIKANKWINDKGYQFINIDPKARGNIVASFLRWIFEALYELFFNDWGEKQLRAYQIRRILRDPRTQSAKSGQIYISDQELRFHPPKEGIDTKD